MTRAHSGRRPGDSGTREAIEGAARRQFAELGYDRTSLRQVAREAGVDPTLVSHFYGSKQQLFVTVVELPFRPAEVLPQLLEGDPGELGLRLARFILGVFESAQSRGQVIGIVRSATSEPEAARLVRDMLTREVLTPLAEGLGVADAEFRAGLLGSQVVGMIMARYIVAIEPLASRDAAEVALAIAPNLQHYLTGDLSSSR
ncbi:TetR family transcriptional regulator [Cellulomonas sp. P24]|uniref:TetR/AcrR family transcriptional regulator n=1 Tax=Cellulomonas sp. P24 TaxID=2885206 RepID=UPI00216B03A6|nr:TetR family transcriptional regulator [Cellulomonas sp. P24]MCR6491520.1 TetR family transcriptional regulator [Cellulomonas sp. P24]